MYRVIYKVFISLKFNMKNLQKSVNKGFTLIELLVVIAIIGILSSVVLASLNSARGKGKDAAIKAEMSNLRASLEIVADSTGVYSTTTSPASTQVASLVSRGATPIGTGSSTGYVYYAPLSTGFFCISGQGEATTTTSAPTTGDSDCD